MAALQERVKALTENAAVNGALDKNLAMNGAAATNGSNGHINGGIGAINGGIGSINGPVNGVGLQRQSRLLRPVTITTKKMLNAQVGTEWVQALTT